MPAATPTIYLARRVQHRNEAEPLQKAMAAVGWKEASKPEAASIIWDVETLADTTREAEPQPHQIVNRVPAMLHCCRKAVYARLLARWRALLPPGSFLDDGRYLPNQWALPLQADVLAPTVQERAAAAKRAGKAAPVYIVKPDGGSMGDGIQLTPEPCRAGWQSSQQRVVQEYIGRPLLLDGLKFDLRLYVLVTSTSPLRAYLYREGLARFAVDAYVPPQADNLRNVHMHLTNYSLNKKAGGFVSNDEPDGGSDGSKRTVSSVFAALQRSGQVKDVDELWEEIGALVGRALGALLPVLPSSTTASATATSSSCCSTTAARSNTPLSAPMSKSPTPPPSSSSSSSSSSRTPPRCFHLLGFDVLLDDHCRPWLIEINDHPSFRTDLSYDEPGQYSMNGLNSVPSPVDEAIKLPMLADAMRLVGAAFQLRTRGRKNRGGSRKGGAARRRAAAGATGRGGRVVRDAVLGGGGAAATEAEAATAADEEETTAPVGAAPTADMMSASDWEQEEETAEEGAAEAELDADAEVAEVAGAEGASGPTAAAATGGVHGTSFFEVPTDALAKDKGFELLTRLRALFDAHTPASARRDDGAWHSPPLEALAVPGPRWKGAAPLGTMLQSAGLLARGAGAHSSAKGVLGRPDLELAVLAVCGKGGSMDVVDFMECLVRVARKLWPERAATVHPSELLTALFETHFPGDV